MSVYVPTPVLPHENSPRSTSFVPPYPHLSPSPGSGHNAPQAYMNVDPQLKRTPDQTQAQPQSESQFQTPTQPSSKSKKGDNAGEGKARLRKACDSCSQRKVKCDETGPPCKACSGLGIPCTYLRTSKRRGPPNRLAENIKRSRFQGDGMSQPSSPTQTAQTLAAFAQQAVFSVEAICPLPIVQSLVDDYFTYIYPLIPLPHKPSFMAALQNREDVHNGTFLALLASMLGCMVASFPRRLRQHFRHHAIPLQYPNSISFISRCHQVSLQAQGAGYPNRQFIIHDAITFYLQAITAEYTHDQRSALRYFSQCQSIISEVGADRTGFANTRTSGAPQARMVPNGHVLEGPQSEQQDDYVVQELKKRTFWLMFMSVRSLQQRNTSDWELFMRPATKSKPYPPLPMEVDDECLTPARVYPQPPDVLPELAGFNANVRVLTTYDGLATVQLLQGADEVPELTEWTRQKRILEKSLRAVKQICEGLPAALSSGLQAPQAQINGLQYPPPAPGFSGVQQLDQYPGNSFENSRRIQIEIQKANMYASQLCTRLYLIEQYITLRDAHSHQNDTNNTTTSSNRPIPPQDQNNPSPMTPQDFTNELTNTIKTTLRFLTSLTQSNMEPCGTSLIFKTRQLATSLLDLAHSRRNEAILAPNAEEYLKSFLNILSKLEGGEARGDGMMDQDDETQSRYWTELRAAQTVFQSSGGVSPH